MKRTIGRLIVGVAVATAGIGAGAAPALAGPPPCTGSGCDGGPGAAVDHSFCQDIFGAPGNIVFTPSGNINVHCKF